MKAAGRGSFERLYCIARAVLNSAGDTVQTLEGPASSGLHRVYWGLMGEGDPEPLSPSERRDSIQAAALITTVTDSMIAAGGNEAAIDSVLAMLQSGNIESPVSYTHLRA